MDTLSLLEAIVLGIVQGVTEFLPVSSSGHLVLFGALFQIDQPGMIYEIFLHFGTLIAVFVAFWPDVKLLFKSGIKLITSPTQIPKLIKTDQGCGLFFTIVIATIPIVIVGLFFQDWITGLFNNPRLAGYMLILTGTIIFISDRFTKGEKKLAEISSQDGFLIGIGQALAIFPGLSRSGTTIAAGLFRKIDRESAARFSFLLSIPAILGSQVLAIKDLFTVSISGQALLFMIIGTIIAALTGYFAIRLLLNFVRKGRLIVFSYYTWAVGLLVVLINR